LLLWKLRLMRWLERQQQQHRRVLDRVPRLFRVRDSLVLLLNNVSPNVRRLGAHQSCLHGHDLHDQRNVRLRLSHDLSQ